MDYSLLKDVTSMKVALVKCTRNTFFHDDVTLMIVR